MTNYLFQTNLGPVQGFISTARRSRDLWFGSYILSELSKSVALAIHKQHGKLIFPFVDNFEAQLVAESDLLVTNIVFAEIAANDLAGAREIADKAQAAAGERWQELCDEALRQIKDAHSGAEKFYDSAIWTAQLGDVVEIYSAIVPIQANGYADANNRLRELIANRKNTRSFEPYHDHAHRPKSSLDGAQSSVLIPKAVGSSPAQQLRWRQRLGIDPSEQLDTAALVKRVIGRDRGFIPAARVAANAWIKQAANSGDETIKTHWNSVLEQLDALAKSNLGTKLEGKYTEYEWLKPLLFDGQLLYRHRIPAEIARIAETKYGEEFAGIKENLTLLDRQLAKLYKSNLGAPCPYYGLLLADGDKMGQLIDKANEGASDSEKHRNISKALSCFAQSVPALMNQFDGACIYSGGDDVLGLVPLDQALTASAAISKSFKEQLDKVAEDCGLAQKERPTLSVGIAIVHFLQPLGDARTLAAKAEKIAKGGNLATGLQRNALCLLAQPRSGQTITVRIRWDDKNAMDRLRLWTQQLESLDNKTRMPRGLPHELEAAYSACRAAFPKNAKSDEADEKFKAYWQVQLQAILDKKRTDDEGLSEEIKESLIADLCDKPTHPQDPAQFQPLAQLLMARWLSGRALGDER